MKLSRKPSGQPPAATTESGTRAALGLVLAAGLVLRLLYLLEFRETPYFLAHILGGHDQRTWAEMALRVMSAPWFVDGRPFYQAPGYAYYLALVFRLFGPGNYLAAGIVQAFTDTGSGALLFLAGRRLWNARVGLAAALVHAFYRPFVVYSVTILSDSFILFTNLLCLVLFLAAIEQPGSGRRWAAAGLAFGLATATRPTILLFLFTALPAWLLIGRARGNPLPPPPAGRALARAAGLFGLAFLLPVLPLVIRNSLMAGQFTTVATYGRINWEIGNSAHSIGLYLNPLDPQSPPLGPLLSPLSAAFWRLQALKSLFFVTAYEWPQNLNLYLLSDISRILSLPLFNIGLVMPAGLAGIIAAFNRRQSWAAIYTLTAMAGVIAIFVTSRYRLPAIGGLVLCACGLADLAWRVALRARRAGKIVFDRETARLGFSLAALAFLSYTLVNTWSGNLVSEVYARNYAIMTPRAAAWWRDRGNEARAEAIERRFRDFTKRYEAGEIR